MIKHFEHSKPITKLLMLIAINIVIEIAIGVFFVITSILMKKNPYNMNLNLMVLFSSFSIGLTVVIYNMLFEKKEIYKSTFAFKVKPWYLLIAIGLFFAFIPIENNLSLWCKSWNVEQSSLIKSLFSSSFDIQNGSIMKSSTIKELLIAIFTVCLFPACFEEWLFRGTLQKLFISWTKNAYIGIILTCICFSILHIDIHVILAIFTSSLLLCLVYYYTDCIWINISIHFLNNLMATLLLWLKNRGVLNEKDIQEEYMGWYLVAVSIIAIVVWIVWSEKRKRIINVENK